MYVNIAWYLGICFSKIDNRKRNHVLRYIWLNSFIDRTLFHLLLNIHFQYSFGIFIISWENTVKIHHVDILTIISHIIWGQLGFLKDFLFIISKERRDINLWLGLIHMNLLLILKINFTHIFLLLFLDNLL